MAKTDPLDVSDDFGWSKGYSIKISSKYVPWDNKYPNNYREWEDLGDYILHENCRNDRVHRLFLPEVYENLIDGGAKDNGCYFDEEPYYYVHIRGKKNKNSYIVINLAEFWERDYKERMITYRKSFIVGAAVSKVEPRS